MRLKEVVTAFQSSQWKAQKASNRNADLGQRGGRRRTGGGEETISVTWPGATLSSWLNPRSGTCGSTMAITVEMLVGACYTALLATILVEQATLVTAWSQLSRRDWFLSTHAALLASTSSSTLAVDELPMRLRRFTKLAPLGRPQVSSNKTIGLSLEELAARLGHDLESGATGRKGYIVSGDLSADLFRDDCRFVDPTNTVNSLSQYQNALKILFDPQASTVELLGPLSTHASSRTIYGRFRSRGVLQLPWRPYVTAYESSIVYQIDRDGLVEQQMQSWTKSAAKALQESFTPSLFTPPPISIRPRPENEPKVITELFERVNGRRMDEYTDEERIDIDQLVRAVAERREPFAESLFPGKWRLAYLQPGPNGAGVDRRIPFPEFGFNDNYQLFGQGSVENVGQLFGPLVDVRVFGSVQPLDSSMASPKRFKADIQGGKLCTRQTCFIDLPITGQGLFDSIYVGERLRIGQNLNGGGSRVVQVRAD